MLNWVKQSESGTSDSNKKVAFTYNDDGSLETLTRYSCTTFDTRKGSSHYEYDRLARLIDLVHKDNSATPVDLVDYDWLYDAVGRITDMDAAYDDVLLDAIISDFGYDNTDQLISANHGDQSNEGYAYDATGNRTNGDYETFADSNRLESDGTFDYTYDDEGNRLTRTRTGTGYFADYLTTYTWDHRNRLTSVTFTDNADPQVETKKVEYTYDHRDRRIQKKVTEGAEENDYYNVYLGGRIAMGR